MAGGLIVGGFDFDTGDVELAAVQQAHVGAATLGAATMETVVLKDLAAVQALALWMDLLHGKLAALRERVLVAKRLPGKVERLAHDLGHIPDTQRYLNGARGPRPTRRANHCIEYAVDNANLVHTDLLLIVLVVREQVQTAHEQALLALARGNDHAGDSERDLVE